MTNDEFKNVVVETVQNIYKVLATKGDEYSGIEDRLQNFKDAAKILKCHPEQALLGFVTKQIVSAYDSIQILNFRNMEYWDEKLGDVINYMILLKALLVERGIK